MDKKLKQFTLETKVLDATNRIIEMIGSTESFDRAGDRMIMSGVKLENYLKNPVILANHNYGYSEKPSTIGRALSINIQGKQLIFKIQFAETDNGKEWFYLYSEKYMNASSIGFIPLEYTPNTEGGYDFTSWELLELSLVAVPCNPEAVQRAYAAGLISKGLFEQINAKENNDMTKEEIEALIAKAIAEIKTEPPAEPVDHTAEIKGLQDQIKELTEKLKEPTGKSGASISAKNAEVIKACCKGIAEHIKALEDMCSTKEDPNTEEGKEYSDEEIQKVIQEKVAKLLKEAK